MFLNFLTVFLRTLWRNRLFSIINLFGLTAGITTTLVIFLYIRNDFEHDRFHENADRIYRVNQTNIWGDNSQQLARVGPGVGHAMLSELPEVELMTSIYEVDNSVVTYIDSSNQTFAADQENILAADTNFFRMFSFELLAGDLKTCLRHPQTVVITKSTSEKYFGPEKALGRVLQVGTGADLRPFEVTGVMPDITDDSYVDVEMLMSISSFPRFEQRKESWIWTQLQTFIMLDKNSDVKDTRRKLEPIPHRYAEASVQGGMSMSFDEYLKTGKSWNLYLQPLTEIHLYSDNVLGNSNIVGNRKITYTLVGIAIFIILLSCINFMNLSTAQFTKRTREVGIRKILGGGRTELGLSYVFEAFMFCSLALVLAFALTQITIPSLNQVTGKNLEMSLGLDLGFVLTIVAILVLMSILCGSFPALFLTALRPSEAIKGKVTAGPKGKGIRNGLVILQFTISIALITSTIIVYQQLHFASLKNLGFDKENLLVIDHVERASSGLTLANSISNIPGILNTSFCAGVPMHMGNDVFRPENYGDKDFKLYFAAADEHYLATLGVEIVVGRNLSSGPADIDGVILNETAVKTLGWKVDASVIGKVINYPNENTEFQVRGVVRDYHFTSLETRIEPMAIFHTGSKVFSQRKYVLVRVASQDTQAWETTFMMLRKLWKEQAGDLPFNYEFVDQSFAAKLQTQLQFGKTLQIMAGLALAIAGLGLIGMVIYSLETRTKEIGIRKVSGAGVWNILALVSQGHTKLIIVAFVIGAPLSYWLTQQWLLDFDNRITPSLWVFVLTGLGTLLFSFLITSYHSVKAALTNPIDVLKDE